MSLFEWRSTSRERDKEEEFGKTESIGLSLMLLLWSEFLRKKNFSAC